MQYGQMLGEPQGLFDGMTILEAQIQLVPSS